MRPCWKNMGRRVFCGSYGAQKNVTYIINQMRKDKKNRGHPSLRMTAL